MKIDLMNINKFIEVNNIQEVYDPVLLSKGNYPTEGGLFSYEIFGRPGSYDRKTLYGYIDLKDKFIHPLVYKTLIRINRKIEECVSGISYFKINEDGELIKVDDENEGKTGLNFLYTNWNKINFKSTESNKREERLDFLKALKKDEIFCDKWLVMPAFFRDINTAESSSGRVSHDKINDMYAKLIRLVKALEENQASGIDFVSNTTKGNIEKYLVEIYDYTIGLTKKKNGLFRQAVMGKSIDYSARSVISAASFSETNKYTDMKVDMTHTGCPIAILLSTFNPFIIACVENFFKNRINENLMLKHKNNNEVVELAKDVMDDFSYDKIKEKIALFIKAPSERFETVKVKLSDNTYKPIYYRGSSKKISDDDLEGNKSDSTIYNRYLTWTDVFYQACIDVCKDKYVYITRYPLEDYFGIYPSKVTVLSTIKTSPQYIEGKYYEYYPVIDPSLDKSKVQGLFLDSVEVFNAYLGGLGGDFDGKNCSRF